MQTFRAYLILFFLVLSCSAHAQEDTTGGDKGWMNMPVVSDTPRTDTQTIILPNQDSLKAAKVADSLKKTGVDEKEFIKNQIKALCGKGMSGRGYVRSGWDSAGKYILKKFREYNLKSVVEKGPYAQGFAFPVNTFPGAMDMFVNGDSLHPGIEFIVDAASSSWVMDSTTEKMKVKKWKLGKVRDTADWMSKIASVDSAGRHAYLLDGIDDVCESLQMRKARVLAMLPKGVYIIPQEKRLTWNVSREQMAATVLYVREDSMPKKIKNVKLNIEAVYNPHQRSENIIACVPGQIKDSFIVFTAHYDHLGMMGKKTVFQGASDNASGVAMLLYLANYYSRHPQKYSILFIAFAGEEASLMGSEFFVFHPFVPLGSIKFLTNIDIMGDATNGITVVNAVENVGHFARLQEINDKEKYLRALMPRENAANSDQYYFAKKRVPCFYIYSNGGNGFRNDVYDVKTLLSLNNVDKVSRLLIDFVAEFKEMPAPVPAEGTIPADNAQPQEPATPPAEGTTPAQEPSPVPVEPSAPPKEEGPSQVPEETPGK